MEDTIRRIQSHKGVLGTLIVNRDGRAIKSSFDREETTKYAGRPFPVPLPFSKMSYAEISSFQSGLISQLTTKAVSVVRTLDATVPHPSAPQSKFLLTMVCTSTSRERVHSFLLFGLQNDLTFLRVRSKKYEIMVAPGALRSRSCFRK